MSCSVQQKKLGGLEPVDPNSDKIKEISAWAVNEYNKKEGTCLKFIRALKAEEQVVAGMNYYIELEAANGCLINKYFTKVFVQEWTKTMILEKFVPLLQENAPIAVAN